MRRRHALQVQGRSCQVQQGVATCCQAPYKAGRAEIGFYDRYHYWNYGCSLYIRGESVPEESRGVSFA